MSQTSRIVQDCTTITFLSFSVVSERAQADVTVLCQASRLKISLWDFRNATLAIGRSCKSDGRYLFLVSELETRTLLDRVLEIYRVVMH